MHRCFRRGHSAETNRCMSPSSMSQKSPRPKYSCKSHLPVAVQPSDCDSNPHSLNSRVFKHGQLKHCTRFKMSTQTEKTDAAFERLHQWPFCQTTLSYISKGSYSRKQSGPGYALCCQKLHASGKSDAYPPLCFIPPRILNGSLCPPTSSDLCNELKDENLRSRLIYWDILVTHFNCAVE